MSTYALRCLLPPAPCILVLASDTPAALVADGRYRLPHASYVLPPLILSLPIVFSVPSLSVVDVCVLDLHFHLLILGFSSTPIVVSVSWHGCHYRRRARVCSLAKHLTGKQSRGSFEMRSVHRLLPRASVANLVPLPSFYARHCMPVRLRYITAYEPRRQNLAPPPRSPTILSTPSQLQRSQMVGSLSANRHICRLNVGAGSTRTLG